LNYSDFAKHVKKGDFVYAHDSIYKFEVLRTEKQKITFLSHSDGLLLKAKGLHLPGVYKNLPFLFDRDVELIRAAIQAKADIISLSFVRSAEDVRIARRTLSDFGGEGLEIFAKIETASALENLDEIVKEVEVVNVDRGDLSSDIGLLNLPQAQDL